MADSPLPAPVHGDTAVRVETPHWLGVIDPAAGGNLVSLRHKGVGAELLRAPPSAQALRRRPAVYGLPLLMPPNRIADGRFTFEERPYRLPVNDEPETRCHIHGLALGKTFRLESLRAEAEACAAALSWTFGPDDPAYAGFPHAFRVELEYRFRGERLEHRLRVENRSARAMPLGVGFHSAFAAPRTERCRIEMTAPGGPWRLDPVRRIPDGARDAWTDGEREALAGRRDISGVAMARMFPLETAERRVRLRRAGFTLDYVFDGKFKHFAIWNDGAGNDFVCLEPMSWMTDAPNVPLAPEITGLRSLAPGGMAEFVSWLSVEPGRFDP